MSNYIDLWDEIKFVFFLLLGKLPIWVIVIACLIGNIPFASLALFFICIVLARGWLYAYSYDLTLYDGGAYTAIRHIFKPIGIFVFYIIAYLAILYVVLHGDKTDQIILLAAFGAFILLTTVSSFASAPADAHQPTLIKRSRWVAVAIVALWLCLLFNNFANVYLNAAILIVIYLAEYLSTHKEIQRLSPARG